MVDRWPLTGRTEELRVIGDALADDVCSGMVIAGPAGVGKTRLARTAGDIAAQSGWAVQRIAGTAAGRPLTLGAFARWADATDGSPLMLARKVLSGLTAETHGARLLILVDDAHLLDDLSALIVHQLVLQEAASVIATVRTGELTSDAVTALWKDSLLRRMDLQALSRNESDELLRTVLGGRVDTDCCARMWSLSRGNVLFLYHLVEHERESERLFQVDDEWRWRGTPSVSATLADLVQLQIGAIPDGVRDVVDVVAIAEPVDRMLLASITDQHAIEDAEERGLITASADSGSVYVGHPLYGEIRLSQCGPLRLRRLRGRVATAMARSTGVDPLRLGLLWVDSDLPPDADVLTRSASIAASLLDLGLAHRLARAAHEAKSNQQTTLLLAYILYLQEKGEEAEALLDTLDATAPPTPGFVDSVSLRAANLLMPLRNPGRAREVLDAATQLGNADRNHALYTMRAVIEVMAAQPTETLGIMSAVDYERLDSYGRVIGYAAETIALGDLGRTRLAGQRASAGYQELIESPDDSFHSSGLPKFHAYALLAAGYVAEAESVALRCYEQYTNLPGMSRAIAIATLGMAALGAGDLTAALRHLEAAGQGFGVFGEISGQFWEFSILRTEVLARSGAIDAAAESLATTRRRRHPAYLYLESGGLLASAWVDAVRGDIAHARESSRRAAEFARHHGQLAREVVALQTAVQFGDAVGSARLAELATQVEGPRAALAAEYSRALAADDGPALQAVSRGLEAMGDGLAAADAAAQASVSHRRAGKRGSSLTASARALALAKGAVSPALAAAKMPLPFTRREHEIATLLSRGLSNRDIASATSLSVRTVEGHIYQASAKAGVSGRSELSALVRQFTEF